MPTVRFTTPQRQNPMAEFSQPETNPPTFVAEVRADIEIGEVETLPAGSEAYVRNSGTELHQVWDIGIPSGASGENASIIIRRL